VPLLLFSTHGGAQGGFACTELLGFSQTMQWFGKTSSPGHRRPGRPADLSADGFLPGWQARITPGASLEKWTSPQFEGWEGRHRSPAHCRREEVDRVIFNVSGSPQPPDGWARDIAAVAAVIRSRYPGVREIVMQPVVGAGEDQCPEVRAAANQPVIEEGIRRAAQVDGMIRPGPSAKVSACTQFRDRLGHLTEDGAARVRAWLRDYYGR
jgi:hypothetical protein